MWKYIHKEILVTMYGLNVALLVGQVPTIGNVMYFLEAFHQHSKVQP